MVGDGDQGTLHTPVAMIGYLDKHDGEQHTNEPLRRRGESEYL